MKKSLLLLTIVTTLSLPALSSAQNRLDLEDVTIQGDLLNDNRLRVNSRGPAAIDDRVKYRKNYRNEILEEFDPITTGEKPASSETPAL